jgi:putative membrane protein
VSEAGDVLASVNATLNGASAILIGFGWRAIRARERTRHRNLMLSALGVSTVFLIGYLTRILLSGTHRYPGHGALRAFYLGLLGSHMLLAAITPPLVLTAVWLALTKRFAQHRRVVRYTLPVWLYVSVTGVLVYLMLYQLPHN